MKRTNIHLTEAQLARLSELSQRTGLPVAELVRRAVDAHLAREARKS
jgi:predicted DNA-binding protein